MARRLRSGGAIAVLAGLLSFTVAFLGLTALTAPQPPTVVLPVVEATAVSGVTAQRIAAGHVGVGLAVSPDRALLFEAMPGDRLDILAVLPSRADRSPVAAVVVSGASILRPPSIAAQAALLLEVTPSDALALAHLIGLGVPLSYALWSERGRSAVVPPIDARAALASLGIAPTAVPPTAVAPPVAQPTAVPPTAVAPTAAQPAPNPPTPVAPTAVPTPVDPSTPVPAEAASVPTPVATPRPTVYTVRPGDTMAGIARQFAVDFTALMWANRRLPDRNLLLPGTEIFLPDYRGSLYIVRAGDTWDELGRSLGYPSDTLRQINELPPAAPLEAGMQLFLPSGL